MRLTPINIKYKSATILFLLFLVGVAAKAQLPDKASPFTAVKWEDEKAIVRFEGQWYTFQSINGITSAAIFDFCKKAYEDRWKKRFSEDLVEVMTKMGHTPTEKVRLVLEKGGDKFTKTGVMSKENRNLVRDYNNGEVAGKVGNDTGVNNQNNDLSSTAAQQRMAEQMAEWMDMVWEQDPPKEAAHLRFEFYKNGKLYAGKISIHGDFTFWARSRAQHTQAFNPNKNGRWVYEDLAPGTYEITITGINEFEGFSWKKDAVKVEAGTTPLFKVNLD